MEPSIIPSWLSSPPQWAMYSSHLVECVSHPEVSGGTPVPDNMLFIKFWLIKQHGRPLYTDEHTKLAAYREQLVGEGEFMLPVDFMSDESCWYLRMALKMFQMGVMVDHEGLIINDLFTAAQCTVPGMAILVGIGDSILHRTVDSHRYSGETSRVESRTAYAHGTPAAKSCLKGLVKVRVDDDVIRETALCVICHENLDHFDHNAAEEEGVADLDLDHQPLITVLPCSHRFHGYCIVRWLKIQHLCPICRYPMPTEEGIDEPKSKRRRVM